MVSTTKYQNKLTFLTNNFKPQQIAYIELVNVLLISGLEFINLFSCAAEGSMKLILLIVKLHNEYV